MVSPTHVHTHLVVEVCVCVCTCVSRLVASPPLLCSLKCHSIGNLQSPGSQLQG